MPASPTASGCSSRRSRTLFFRLTSVGDEIAGALGREEFTEAMAALAKLRRPVDAFFDRVTVNADEPELRENRCACWPRSARRSARSPISR